MPNAFRTLSSTERNFLKVCTKRDIVNLIMISLLMFLVYLAWLFFGQAEYQFGAYNIFIVFFIILVIFTISPILNQIERVVFIDHGHWYCPLCFFRHKRDASSVSYCMNPSTSIHPEDQTRTVPLCPIRIANTPLPHKHRVYKFKLIAWCAWVSNYCEEKLGVVPAQS